MLRKVTEDNKDNHTAHLIYINKVEGRIIPTVNKGDGNAKEKGMWIAPKFEKPKKRKKRIWIVCLAIVAVLAVVASFFLSRGKLVPVKGADSLKTDSVTTETVNPIEQKGDTSNQSAPVTRPAPSNGNAATGDEPSTNNDPQPPVQPRQQTINKKRNIVDKLIEATNSATEEVNDNNSKED